ncbi:hypothetical protein HD596_000474 [Nonomuraea jabiensis]|uniref:Uncharacterized protein n=1 Tax=Nonomuraea jabiensis TaxID=882448 RepID=A0A7W9FY62_9ACTN|nr:hypothetical protein [Nonomuraea jabiensis]MBB5773718.1 hypothetical protein [Nonomuraea jabiensis]
MPDDVRDALAQHVRERLPEVLGHLVHALGQNGADAGRPQRGPYPAQLGHQRRPTGARHGGADLRVRLPGEPFHVAELGERLPGIGVVLQ